MRVADVTPDTICEMTVREVIGKKVSGGYTTDACNYHQTHVRVLQVPVTFDGQRSGVLVEALDPTRLADLENNVRVTTPLRHQYGRTWLVRARDLDRPIEAAEADQVQQRARALTAATAVCQRVGNATVTSAGGRVTVTFEAVDTPTAATLAGRWLDHAEVGGAVARLTRSSAVLTGDVAAGVLETVADTICEGLAPDAPTLTAAIS